MTERQKRYTPGPWGSYSVTAITGGHHIGSESGLLAVTVKGEAQARYVDDSNANLISAAPELLEALEMVWKKILSEHPADSPLRKYAEDAISKAYGEDE